MEEDENERLRECVLKKATGYTATETQEEYSLIDGEMTLTKRKVTYKEVPPDLTALKLLLDSREDDSVTEDELEREKRELTEEYFRRLKELSQK